MLEFVTLDGVTLHDLSTDSNVQVSTVSGLTGVPTVRGEVYDDPDGDGVVEPANQFVGARISAWDCAVFGSTVAVARANWSTFHATLLAALRQPKQLRWRWLGDSLAFQSSVRLSGMTPPSFTAANGPWFSFQILLRAADPTNYSQVSTTTTTGAPTTSVSGITWPVTWPVSWSIVVTGSGSISVTNSGDADAWPLIDITGPITNPIISNQTSGKSLFFDGLTIADGQTLSISMRPARATIGGVSQKSFLRLSASEFFSVGPNATESIAFAGSGTTTNTLMAVTMRSAYLT